ncbi:para-nitrobenzyl esterase [Bradyrhizobium sp. AZCC 1588]|uniref:carboxylesterase/lipase family protein n=1 Tax=unclassified Bradyrhizobium TaxID=2631580 RepID=UPI002FF1B3A8
MNGRLYRKVLLVAAASALGALSPAAAQTAPTVTVEAGIIRGVASNDVAAFKGVPYAAPPVGALRWRAPQPAAAWRDVRQAAEYGSDCVQKPTPGAAAASGGKFDEDCLFLNVWRPAALKPGDRFPVLVWIHGGGFIAGGASAPTFDGSALAGQGLVVVSLNYRLGRLGFFMHPALTASDEEAPGNYGFLDQLAALQWVQRNIAQFGGDAKQVTIAGESAGAVSVMHHLAWPAAHGLFHRAVVMSGGGRTYGIGASRARAEEAGVAFVQSVGITGSGADVLAALRALPAQKVSSDLGVEALLGKVDTYAGGPIVDGKIVTGMDMPGEALRKRTAAKVPVLIGTTSDDLPVVFPPRDNPLSFFGADAPVANAVYFASAVDPGAAIKNIAVDITMHEPARFVAKQVTAAGQPAWLYRFGYVAESLRPKGTAEHAKEVSYLFGTLAATYGAAATAKDRAMADLFMGYIAEFAKTGDPNRSGLPTWPPFDPAKSELMMFTPDATAVVQADPWKSRLDLIERAVERQAVPPQ